MAAGMRGYAHQLQPQSLLYPHQSQVAAYSSLEHQSQGVQSRNVTQSQALGSNNRL